MFETTGGGQSSSGADGTNSTKGADELEPWAEVGEWNQKQLLSYEKQNLGFYVSGHPLDRFAELTREVASTPIHTLPSCDRFQLVTLIGTVSAMRAIPSKQGGRIAFVTLEDRTGEVELFVSPQQLEVYEKTLGSGEPIMITGEVKHSRGDEEAFPKVDIGKRGEDPRSFPFVQTLPEVQVAKTKALEVRLPRLAEPKAVLRRLNALCLESKHQGRCPLLIQLRTAQGAEVSLSTPFLVHPDEELAHELRQLAEGVEVHHLGPGTVKAMKHEVVAGQQRAHALVGVQV
jgi:DNA polymerase-3 subunit alpha